MASKCDVLVIECTTWSPHLETAGEISLHEKFLGKNVAFCFLKIDNPDEYWSWKQDILCASRFKKVAMLERLLADQGVAVIDREILKNNDEIKYFGSKLILNSHVRSLKYKSANLGRGIYSSLVSRFMTIDPFSEVSIDKILERYIRSSIMAFNESVDLIKELRPDKIVVFNGRFALNSAICEAAKYCNIPVWYHERGANIYKYYYSYIAIHDIEKLKEMIKNSWNEAKVNKFEIANSFFQKRKLGDGIGWYSFVTNQKRCFYPSKQKKRFTFFSSSEDEYEGLDQYFKHFLFPSQRDAINYLVNYFKTVDNAELVIRVHPNLAMRSSKDVEWWNSISGHNVVLIRSESKVDSYSLLESSDVVLSYGSTMGVEAIYWGKPSILLGDSPLSGCECFYEPESIKDLNYLLSCSKLKCVGRECVYPYGYFYMTFGYDYEYYTPNTLGSGLFLGKKLDIYPKLISWMLNLKR